MYDQAHDLRRLVRHFAQSGGDRAQRRPALVLLASGKGGVGTTTIAVNLAVALAQQGARTVLVDADPEGGDVALFCRLEDRPTLDDVAGARYSLADVLQPGPGGVRVAAGTWQRERPSRLPAATATRWLAQLPQLEDTDFVIADAGNGHSAAVQALWDAADLALMVTTPEPAAIMNTYALVKVLADATRPGCVACLVNRAVEPASQAVHARFAQACRRFLSCELASAGSIPDDPQVAAAGKSATAFQLAYPACSAARPLGRLAQFVMNSLKPTSPIASPHSFGKNDLTRRRAPSDIGGHCR